MMRHVPTPMHRHLLSVGFLLLTLALLAACAQQPQTVEKVVTQVVEKEVTTVVEKEVTSVVEKEVTTVVEKELEVVVTATPAPKTINIGMTELVTSLDPPTDWAIAATWIHMNMFDCLVWRNRATAAFEPWLAESYENLDDTTWRFNLRQGVTFHNGEPFNADAVVWTYERILADETMITYPQWTFIKEVIPVDEYTVDIVTTAPEPAMLSKMSGTGCGIQAPEHGRQQAESGEEYVPIGTGPFMFDEWAKDDHITLVANPNYWQGEPDIDTLVFKAIPETSTRVANLLTGDIDLMVGVPKPDWERINANEGTSVSEYLTNRTMLLALRTGPSDPMPDWTGPTSDVRVRQAIQYAIDRRALVDLIDGMGVPTLSRITPPTLGWSEKFFNQWGEYDPERARELLEEAGYNGEPITFHASTAFIYEKEVAEAIAAMLQEVGLNVDLQVLDVTTFREQVYFPNKNEEIYMDALGNSFFDPWITVKEFEPGQKQRSGWQNQEADELILAAATNMDPEERRAQYVRIQELINEDVPHIYLYLMKDAFGKSNRLDFSIGPDGFLWMGHAKVTD